MREDDTARGVEVDLLGGDQDIDNDVTLHAFIDLVRSRVKLIDHQAQVILYRTVHIEPDILGYQDIQAGKSSRLGNADQLRGDAADRPDLAGSVQADATGPGLEGPKLNTAGTTGDQGDVVRGHVVGPYGAAGHHADRAVVGADAVQLDHFAGSIPFPTFGQPVVPAVPVDVPVMIVDPDITGLAGHSVFLHIGIQADVAVDVRDEEIARDHAAFRSIHRPGGGYKLHCVGVEQGAGIQVQVAGGLDTDQVHTQQAAADVQIGFTFDAHFPCA